MKRLYIAISFLVISIALCVFEQITIKDIYTNTHSYIESAIAEIEKNDYTAAEKSCEELTELWNKKYPYLTAITEHGPLDDASVTINSLSKLAQNKSDELEKELITADNQVKIIYESKMITFGNVF